MKRTVAALTVVAMFSGASTFAQDSSAHDAAAQLRRARLKTWIGVGLIGAGALVLPITAATEPVDYPKETGTIGIALVATGMP